MTSQFNKDTVQRARKYLVGYLAGVNALTTAVAKVGDAAFVAGGAVADAGAWLDETLHSAAGKLNDYSVDVKGRFNEEAAQHGVDLLGHVVKVDKSAGANSTQRDPKDMSRDEMMEEIIKGYGLSEDARPALEQLPTESLMDGVNILRNH